MKNGQQSLKTNVNHTIGKASRHPCTTMGNSFHTMKVIVYTMEIFSLARERNTETRQRANVHHHISKENKVGHCRHSLTNLHSWRNGPLFVL